ncbi:MAG: HD domain-containing protein [Stomatobaculum sp.]
MNSEYLSYLYRRSPGAREIIESNTFRRLRQFPRHIYTNTFDHCIRVAVCMAWLAEKNGLDVDSAVKTGLLHDLCFVDYTRKNDHPGIYCFYHPEEAAENASAEFGLTPEEARAIRAHMFPLSLHLPVGKLAFNLILADKLTASYEVLYGFSFMRRTIAAMAEKHTIRTA